MLKNCTKKIEKLLKNVEKMLMCGCGCEVRPLQIGGAHTCACAPKSGHARCVRATQKTVATHTLENIFIYEMKTGVKVAALGAFYSLSIVEKYSEKAKHGCLFIRKFRALTCCSEKSNTFLQLLPGSTK